MKHSLLITSIVICLLGADSVYAQIHGTYPQNNVALSLLRITGKPSPDTLETVNTHNGKFAFTTQLKEPGIYTLFLHDLDWNIPMLLENQNNTIAIPNLQSVQIKGGKLQKQITDCQQKLQKLTKQQIAITELLKQEKDENQQARLHNQQLQLEKQSNEIIKHYIRNNSTNMAGLFLVWDKMEWVNFQELENRFLLLDEKLQTGPIGQSIRQKIDKRWYLKPGGIARDFTIPDTLGNPVSLSSIKAKVKLLDFWASWCRPCRAKMKELKEVYPKLQKKGIIVCSISLDEKREQWEKATREDGIVWANTCDQKPFRTNEIAAAYKVTSVPTLFVIDPQGVIISQNPSLEEILQLELK